MSREIMQQALDVIKNATHQIEAEWIYDYEDGREAIAALEAELAKPEQPTLRKAAEMALAALEPITSESIESALIAAKNARYFLRQALAQLEQEPSQPPVFIGVDVTPEGTHVTAFYRKPDAVPEMFYSEFHPLAQPEQEPVAWWCAGSVSTRKRYFEEMGWSTPKPLYFAPTKREWVGLTNDEIDGFRSGYQSGRIETFVELIQVIEAKLREKNS